MFGRWTLPIGEKACLVTERFTNRTDFVDGKVHHYTIESSEVKSTLTTKTLNLCPTKSGRMDNESQSKRFS